MGLSLVLAPYRWHGVCRSYFSLWPPPSPPAPPSSPIHTALDGPGGEQYEGAAGEDLAYHRHLCRQQATRGSHTYCMQLHTYYIRSASSLPLVPMLLAVNLGSVHLRIVLVNFLIQNSSWP